MDSLIPYIEVMQGRITGRNVIWIGRGERVNNRAAFVFYFYCSIALYCLAISCILLYCFFALLAVNCILFSVIFIFSLRASILINLNLKQVVKEA